MICTSRSILYYVLAILLLAAVSDTAAALDLFDEPKCEYRPASSFSTTAGASGPFDEAKCAGRTAESFPPADENHFEGMDGGVELTSAEIKGRNMWMVWTGGNDRFWNYMADATFGTFDLLKLISSHPALPYGRANRWKYFGIVNAPCFDKATEPGQYGLWLDQRIVSEDCPPDPFANAEKYPGVKIGARGKNVPVGSYYGRPTGVVGLRLFPNPAFDEEAQDNWEPKAYFNNSDYYLSDDLVRPYRVGMSCAFCHVGPSPSHPPADPNHPKWENLSATVGAQYLWFDRVFAWDWEDSKNNFAYQLIHTYLPGTLDTSLVATDYVMNPRTMNAIYNLRARMQLAKRWGREELAADQLKIKQFNDYVEGGWLTEFFKQPNIVFTPRILKDGSDSVGVLGALNRVYLNIGLFSKEWLRHFNPVIGGRPNTPIMISTARQNSVYWQATVAQTPFMAQYLLKASQPHNLADAPGGEAYLTDNQDVLHSGKVLYAEHCARCHSSKIPAPAPRIDAGHGCSGPNYLQCWQAYWNWTQTDEFKTEMRRMVLSDDFLDDNYLSTDMRIPVTLLQTNICSSLSTNATAGNVWARFSSQTYKQLPSIGTVTVYNPITGEPWQYEMPAGGRGYARVPSLVSLWSTAPYLHNNTVGEFYWRPSVEARMRAFKTGITRLLWPEKRTQDPVLGDKVPGLIHRTTMQSYLTIPRGYLPDPLVKLFNLLGDGLPWLITPDGGIRIGPIPKGTPVGLLGNLELWPETASWTERFQHAYNLVELMTRMAIDLHTLPDNPSNEQARAVFADVVEPLLELSKCPAFVVNRGHYFGTDLSDQDKHALIEYLKTF